MPLGSIQATPWGRDYFFSETTIPKASIFNMQHYYMELNKNSANHAPWVQNGPLPGGH